MWLMTLLFHSPQAIIRYNNLQVWPGPKANIIKSIKLNKITCLILRIAIIRKIYQCKIKICATKKKGGGGGEQLGVISHAHEAQYAIFAQFGPQSQKQVLCQCNSTPQNAPIEEKTRNTHFRIEAEKLNKGFFSTQTEGFKHKRQESDELWTRLPWMGKREQKGTFFLCPEYSLLWRFLNGICSSMVEATNLGSTFLKLE